MSPLISCIVPVFNGELYLAEALESILNQTYRPLEVIVVDDGSTDGTAAVAASYGDRVRYFRQENSGAPTARNVGLGAARGAFAAFLDADDLWHAEKLERQMARFEARPELDYCITHLQNFWTPEFEGERKRFKDHRFAEPLPGYVTATLLARGRTFEKVGGFNAALRLGDTTDWFLRASECGAVMELLPDVLMYRRIHGSNISIGPQGGAMNSSMQNSVLQVMKASLDRRRAQSRAELPSLNFPRSQPHKKD